MLFLCLWLQMPANRWLGCFMRERGIYKPRREGALGLSPPPGEGLLVLIRALKRCYPDRGSHPSIGTPVAFGITWNRIGSEFRSPLFVTAARLLRPAGVLQDSRGMAFSERLNRLPMLNVATYKRCDDSFGKDLGDHRCW